MKHWLDELPFYIAGTMPASDRAALEHHVRECAQCRESLHEWQHIADAVRTTAAGRVRRLPPLRGSYRPGVPITGNGRVTQEERSMLNSAYSSAHETRPRQPVLTLAAALLLVILLGSVLLAVALRNDDTLIPAGGPAGDQSSAGMMQATATASPTISPTPLDIVTATTAPHTTVPVITSTPFATIWPPTVIPAEGEIATPTPAARPTEMTLPTPTPIPFVVQPCRPASRRAAGLRAAGRRPIRGSAVEQLRPGESVDGAALLGLGLAISSTAAIWLKPNSEDKSVSPWQMVYYVNRSRITRRFTASAAQPNCCDG